jgi:hypothetical protein
VPNYCEQLPALLNAVDVEQSVFLVLFDVQNMLVVGQSFCVCGWFA